MTIGITEAGDPAVNSGWQDWVCDGKPAILITKDPDKLGMRLILDCISPRPRNILIHCTITGYGETPLEPGAPAPGGALDTMMRLRSTYGPERVILRVDPIIPMGKGLQTASRVIQGALNRGYEGRVRISFMDNYSHNHNRWRERGLSIPPWNTFHSSIHVRREILARLEDRYPTLSFEVCGEPDMKCAGCVGLEECRILGVDPTNEKGKQRGACTCLALKKQLITRRKPCTHNCVYCYWKD